MMTFTQPWALWLLLAIPPVLLWLRHGIGVGESSTWARAALPLRGLAMLLAILSLAGATALVTVNGVDVFFLLDVSDSIVPEDRDRSEQLIAEKLAEMKAGDRAGIIVMGETALFERELSDSPRFDMITTFPSGGATNLEAGLSLALEALRNETGRIVLFSDGTETTGRARAVIPDLLASHVPVDVVPLTTGISDETLVERLVVPARIAPDAPFQPHAVVAAGRATGADLRLFRNDIQIERLEAQLMPGRNIVTFSPRVESESSAVYRVHLQAEVDRFVENNIGIATVVVDSPLKVLIVTNHQDVIRPVQHAFETGGMETHVIQPSRFPNDLATLHTYGVVLLHDLPAHAFTGQALDRLAHYVEDLGGGLITMGGSQSYGQGNYDNTQLARLLPIHMDAPHQLIKPSLAMVLIIDRSGSMAETYAGVSKLDLAREASLAVADVLHQQDLIGILAFESRSHWVTPLQSAANRAVIPGQLSTLTADGGTDLYPAMREVQRVLAETDAMVKHVLILSDGHSAPGNFEEITRALRAVNATVSTVGIGNDADQALLGSIAAWGEGRFYFTRDVYQVPQIFTTEALVVSRELSIMEEFSPRPGALAPFLQGIPSDSWPTIGGYVATTPRFGADVHLWTPEDTPLLASWRRGLGKVVSLMADIEADWAGQWLHWPAFASLWSQIAHWAFLPRGDEQLEPQLIIEDGFGTVIVDAMDHDGNFINFLTIRTELVGPSGERRILPLVQVGPGRYEVSFPAGETGSYIALVQRPGETPLLASEVVPYSPEYRVLNTTANPLLSQLAYATAGRVLSGTERVFMHPKPKRRPKELWPWLLPLALIAFIGDTVVRYLSPDWKRDLRRALARLRSTNPAFSEYLPGTPAGKDVQTPPHTEATRAELARLRRARQRQKAAEEETPPLTAEK